MRVITEAEVSQTLSMPALIDSVEAAFRDWAHARATNNPRRRVHVPKGTLHLMSAAWSAKNYLGYKSYTSFPTGACFHVMLYSAESGEPLALIEADKLGQMRTGAASGVATRHLSKTNSRVIGILGTGWQAESQLEAVCAVRSIDAIFAYSRDESRRKAFADKMSEILGIPVTATENPREAIEPADIAITITNARDPIFSSEYLKPGLHINAAGANSLARREMDTYSVARCDRIAVDDLEQAKLEAAELLVPHEVRRLNWERLKPLADIVGGLLPGRERDEEITLFKSLGIALEDVAAAALVYEILTK